MSKFESDTSNSNFYKNPFHTAYITVDTCTRYIFMSLSDVSLQFQQLFHGSLSKCHLTCFTEQEILKAPYKVASGWKHSIFFKTKTKY